jgi:hypothetical protein
MASSTMSIRMIEQQLAGLTRRVGKLEALVAQRPKDAWREIVGTSEGDALDRQAAKLGAAWRARENKRR